MIPSHTAERGFTWLQFHSFTTSSRHWPVLATLLSCRPMLHTAGGTTQSFCQGLGSALAAYVPLMVQSLWIWPRQGSPGRGSIEWLLCFGSTSNPLPHPPGSSSMVWGRGQGGDAPMPWQPVAVGKASLSLWEAGVH